MSKVTFFRKNSSIKKGAKEISVKLAGRAFKGGYDCKSKSIGYAVHAFRWGKRLEGGHKAIVAAPYGGLQCFAFHPRQDGDAVIFSDKGAPEPPGNLPASYTIYCKRGI